MKVTSISPASRHRSLISISRPAGHDKDWPGHTERRGESGQTSTFSILMHWWKQDEESGMTIKFVFLFSRQGKLRLAKWFNSYHEKVPNQSSSLLTHVFPCRTRRNWLGMWFLSFWLEAPRCAPSSSTRTTSKLSTSAMPGASWCFLERGNLNLALVFYFAMSLHLVLSKDWQYVLKENSFQSFLLLCNRVWRQRVAHAWDHPSLCWGFLSSPYLVHILNSI